MDLKAYPNGSGNYKVKLEFSIGPNCYIVMVMRIIKIKLCVAGLLQTFLVHPSDIGTHKDWDIDPLAMVGTLTDTLSAS